MPFTLYPAFTPSHPHTASRDRFHVPHTRYTVSYTGAHACSPALSWALFILISLSSCHILSLALLRGLGLLRCIMGPVCTALSQEHPRTAAWPQANVPVPRTTPQPLLPAYSAITPTSVSHFPGAPSDKFIKLRDDTVNGHIKKKEKEGKEGKKAQSLSWCCKETLPHSQGHQGGLGEASSLLTITCFLSELPPAGPWYSFLQSPGTGTGVGKHYASVRGCLVRQWLS